MVALSFSQQVSAWVHEVEGAAEAILKQSAQEIVNDMQTDRGNGGRMRVDTGFLRASLRASTATMPLIDQSSKPNRKATYPYNGGDITTTISGLKLGQTIFFGYTAAYAAHREYGSRGQAPDAFVRTAAQKWPAIVSRVEKELATRLGR